MSYCHNESDPGFIESVAREEFLEHVTEEFVDDQPGAPYPTQYNDLITSYDAFLDLRASECAYDFIRPYSTRSRRPASWRCSDATMRFVSASISCMIMVMTI